MAIPAFAAVVSVGPEEVVVAGAEIGFVVANGVRVAEERWHIEEVLLVVVVVVVLAERGGIPVD